MSSDFTVSEPSDREIIAWWDWASKFPTSISPFQTGWGNGAIDYNDQNQPLDPFVFCLSCTAGVGGVDNVPRPLAAAKNRREILIPVFVAGSEISFQNAKQLLGPEPHQTKFLVNDTTQRSFYVETSVGPIEFVTQNSFEEKSRRPPIYFSAGYWAKITSSGVEKLEFGGSAGRQFEYFKAPDGEVQFRDVGSFETGVTYI